VLLLGAASVLLLVQLHLQTAAAQEVDRSVDSSADGPPFVLSVEQMAAGQRVSAQLAHLDPANPFAHTHTHRRQSGGSNRSALTAEHSWRRINRTWPAREGGARTPDEKAYVSIGCIFKDEHRYLVEWIEYHLLVGVDHFHMVTNDCEKSAADASRSLLEPYVTKGVVTLYTEYACAPRGFQNNAYTLLLRKTEAKTFWLMIVDIDEFIVPEDSKLSVGDAMRPFEGFDAVALMWRLFGTSGHSNAPTGSVLFNYRHRASTLGAKDQRARSFKSIVRPDNCKRMATHMCALFACQLNPGLRPPEQCGCTTSTDKQHCITGEKNNILHMRKGRPAFVRVWMHHYRTKSGEEWLFKKARGRASVSVSHSKSKNTGPPPDEYNSVLDETLPKAVATRISLLADRGEAARLRKLLLAGPGSPLGRRPPGGSGRSFGRTRG